jgi:hypothetical protein
VEQNADRMILSQRAEEGFAWGNMLEMTVNVQSHTRMSACYVHEWMSWQCIPRRERGSVSLEGGECCLNY